MRASEILRKFADLIDQTQDGNQKQTGLNPVEVVPPEETTQDLMIPPLQQKLELLKKSVDMDNAFDCNTDNSDDELNNMKRFAGIQISSEDNDITG